MDKQAKHMISNAIGTQVTSNRAVAEQMQDGQTVLIIQPPAFSVGSPKMKTTSIPKTFDANRVG